MFDHFEDIKKVSDALGLPIANGEQDHNFTNFRWLIANDGIDVVQPDYLYFDENQKSKFANVYITLPLLAEWQIPINHYDNRIFISAGLLASFRVNSHTKIKYKADAKQKHKMVDDFSMPTFRYSLMLRTGYRWFKVFASYDLVPLFKDDKGPELTPFTFGITLLRF